MASGTPASNSEDQTPAKADPSPGSRWRLWSRWSEPIVVATVIVALVTALVMGTMAMFQSLKGDINSVKRDLYTVEARLTEVDRTTETRLHEEIQASEARLREEIQASEARLNKRIDEVRADFKAEVKDLKVEMKQDNAEIKAEVRGMGKKLDRVLETLLADQS